MADKRIMAIPPRRILCSSAFYRDTLCLDAVMDDGWIMTFAVPVADARPHVSIAREGGARLSVEVENFEVVQLRDNNAGLEGKYGQDDEASRRRMLLCPQPVRTPHQHSEPRWPEIVAQSESKP